MILEHNGIRLEYDWDHETVSYDGKIVGYGKGITLQAPTYNSLYENFMRTAEVLASQRDCPTCGG